MAPSFYLHKTKVIDNIGDFVGLSEIIIELNFGVMPLAETRYKRNEKMEKCRKNQPGQQKCIKQPEEQKDFLIQAEMERKTYVEVGTDQSEHQAYYPSPSAI